jgi:parallel beta-helix repeat protein
VRITTGGQSIDLRGETYKGNILIQGPVSDVTISNGVVEGEIRCRASSYRDIVDRWNRTADWTQAVQDYAPTNVTLRDLTVRGSGDTHQVYMGPGTTYATIRRVNFIGKSKGPSIYLSMETAHNRVLGCNFNAKTGSRREVLSIDGSADNMILNNRFQRCLWGGIYVYRNSGENGVIRHQEPRRNLISRNRFNLSGMMPIRVGVDEVATELEVPWGIILGSRQGRRERHNDLDAGYPWGSSASDLDYARDNTVTNNSFKGDWLFRWVLDTDEGNTVSGNSSWS